DRRGRQTVDQPAGERCVPCSQDQKRDGYGSLDREGQYRGGNDEDGERGVNGTPGVTARTASVRARCTHDVSRRRGSTLDDGPIFASRRSLRKPFRCTKFPGIAMTFNGCG